MGNVTQTTHVNRVLDNIDKEMLILCQVIQKATSKLTFFYHHVTYSFQSESTLYSCLNVKELFSRNGCDTLSLSDSNEIQTHNHLVHKRTLNHLAKLAKECQEKVSCIKTDRQHD